VRALEEALRATRRIFLSTQHDASVTIRSGRDLCGGNAREHCAEREAAGRNIKFWWKAWERARAVSVATEEGFSGDSENAERGVSLRRKSAVGREDGQPVRTVYQAVAEPELRHDDRGGAGDDPARLQIRLRRICSLPSMKTGFAETVDPLERLNRIGALEMSSRN